MKNNRLKGTFIIGYICLSVLAFALVLIVPQSREVFKELSSAHPFIMGFIKFALLATAGELIAALIAFSKPVAPVKIVWRFVIWGFIGIWITFMMKVYSSLGTNTSSSPSVQEAICTLVSGIRCTVFVT